MQSIIVDISLTTEQYLAHYRQDVKDVVARSRDGRRVRFPSSLLQPYLLHNGIQGSFRISFTETGKFSAIERL
ncbi:DUF2835 domain-containing protein [Amphritea sp. 1_MG-2023]|uniref:DUF2835 domain-containing protein n=1 Tax=Amphritea sp. 1_MG-2023 TaxID=3062670 RepID=UPI0026E253A6|nr:DUF2835 domain-containing protein [Amphritea sp. 1_MG-2023]MDO6562242.1 DUF2835 domain-containing protein [Amphritea sp. 1_MG-2023]